MRKVMEMAPPTVLHLGHDHVWLAWTPPRDLHITHYRLLPASNASSTPEPLMHSAASGTVARINGLNPGAWYSFSVQSLSSGGSTRTLTSPSTHWARTSRSADAVRWPVGIPSLAEAFSHQQRLQAATLFSLDPVRVVAGAALRREYLASLREAARERRRALAPPANAPTPSADAVPCAHCSHWPSRPVYNRFSASVDEQPEVSDADIASVYREYIRRQLAPLRQGGGVTREALEAASLLKPTEWNARYQIISGVAYLVGRDAPTLINHHHRKRLRGVQMLLGDLLSSGAPIADVDFVLNLADAPKVIPRPPRTATNGGEDEARSATEPPAWSGAQLAGLRAPSGCAGFEYSELEPAPHGPFGPVNGLDNMLEANGFVGSLAGNNCAAAATSDAQSSESSGASIGEGSAGVLPVLGATSCCFAADVSFPTVWYDFSNSDDEFKQLDDDSARVPWADKADKAYFRGSIYWFHAHGRTAAFARSLVHPTDVDADWYPQIDTHALESDDTPIFGDLTAHARHRYLLSLEGHSYWSLRIRQLLHLGSAVLHQDLPCHEFWHVLMRPYEHYMPLHRNLSDLMPMIHYARANDEHVQRMVARGSRLARRLLSKAAVLGYVRELLGQYAQLHAAPLVRHEHARPLAAFDWAV